MGLLLLPREARRLPGRLVLPGLRGQVFVRGWLVVVFEAEVGDEVGAHDVAERVLELHRLDEEMVLGVESFTRLRRLQIEAEPLLDADGLERWRAFGQVEE